MLASVLYSYLLCSTLKIILLATWRGPTSSMYMWVCVYMCACAYMHVWCACAQLYECARLRSGGGWVFAWCEWILISPPARESVLWKFVYFCREKASVFISTYVCKNICICKSHCVCECLSVHVKCPHVNWWGQKEEKGKLENGDFIGAHSW